jgi:hypothetical protein
MSEKEREREREREREKERKREREREREKRHGDAPMQGPRAAGAARAARATTHPRSSSQRTDCSPQPESSERRDFNRTSPGEEKDAASVAPPQTRTKLAERTKARTKGSASSETSRMGNVTRETVNARSSAASSWPTVGEGGKERSEKGGRDEEKIREESE